MGCSLRIPESGRVSGRQVYSETYYPRYHFGWSELMAATEDRYRLVRAPRSELYDRTRDRISLAEIERVVIQGGEAE